MLWNYPGSGRLSDLYSFLRPVVDEFKPLVTGVLAIGASVPVGNLLLYSFQLHAYVCVVGANMP